MAIEESRKYLAQIEVLSPEYPSPAAELADVTHLGRLEDCESILGFAEGLDAITYEIEGVCVEALRELESRGQLVLPSAGILGAIRDKLVQRRILAAAGLPVPRFAAVEPRDGEGPCAARGLAAAAEELGGFPAVQKARTGGYDGRGVAMLSGPEDPGCLRCPSYLEERVDIEKELAVVVACAPDGNVGAYPCVEMVFDERANLCDSVLAPARVDDGLRAEAEGLAIGCVRALCAEAERSGSPAAGSAGVFGVEMFLERSGRVLVNEVAPRPHNSGHFSIEACPSSQFDQYIRLLLGLPLGSFELLRPAMMVNLLGEIGASGVPEYLGLEEALAIPSVAVHLYGKSEVRPFRKMGHLTALGSTSEEAIARAEAARALVKIVAR
jgi:5-(carboxyamino)imidazole ribonucleotide synthase